MKNIIHGIWCFCQKCTFNINTDDEKNELRKISAKFINGQLYFLKSMEENLCDLFDMRYKNE